ncbi:protein of unknown function DUF1963 [Cellulophaga algicola DSM 14237]|uniref:DUF1963 domain-containing protein n=1 Tax=Cellulophaga algicola (strain DSM 14237 / IC166 / ACAM 630) TaxID=688270 RepID=E6X9M2_CELAD|nr:DUF1963 domain-containing protein [Cellulophaga algicola]ADV48772.1 protein of unknown function DUF1963 [Cellulophaga algicola DSM 14237]
MTPEEVKSKIFKEATIFKAGGFRPKHTLEESWIGKVTVYTEAESIPLDVHGDLMFPLAQFYLPTLPFVPSKLSKTKIITVFIAPTYPERLEEMGQHWVIREYENLEAIVVKDLSNPESFLKAFPLKPALEKDCPIWDGGGLSPEMEDEVLTLENEGVIDSYYDIADFHQYEHKLGGYPSYCQSGIGIADGFGEGFEFMFQITSDDKINLNVIDRGSLLFAKNDETNKWAIYYDFY